MTVKISKPEVNVRAKLNDLDFAEVPYEKMPSGSVIQVAHKRVSSGWVGTSSSSYVASGAKLSIYPKRKNSLILIEYNFPMTHTPGGGPTLVPKLYRKIGGDSTTLQVIEPGSLSYPQGFINDTGSYQSIVIADQDFPNTELEVEYEVHIRSTQAGSAIYLVHNGSAYYLKLSEVAQ